MKRNLTIFLSILLAIVFFALLVFAIGEIEKVRLLLIESVPDSAGVLLMEQLNLIAVASGGIVVILLAITLSFGLAKQKVITEYVEKVVSPASASTTEEENHVASKEKMLKQKADNIVANLDGSSLKTLGESFLISLSKEYDLVQAIFYTKQNDELEFSLTASYAYYTTDDSVRRFKYGHGLPGQVAMNKELLNLENVPKKYLTIMSGLGDSSPRHLVIFPVLEEGKTIAVVELASFARFNSDTEQVLRLCALRIAEEVVRCSKLAVSEG